jgi:hypothetical protein
MVLARRLIVGIPPEQGRRAFCRSRIAPRLARGGLGYTAGAPNQTKGRLIGAGRAGPPTTIL